MSDTRFDAVVIGSGLGGLTAAALLAKAGRKICVLERNTSIGGAASAFMSGKLRIEPSLHQTADPRDPSEPKHAILKELGLLDEIQWTPIAPFQAVQGAIVGDLFELPVGFDAAAEALSARFPKSRSGIVDLLAAIQLMHAGVGHLMQARSERSIGALLRAGVELRGLVRDWRLSADDMMQRFLGNDEAVKLAIAANIGYYTDDPRRLAWPFFAMAQGGYLKSGGVYVKGGSHVLSMKLARVVMKAGGTVLTGREAMNIELAADGRPASVRHVDARAKTKDELLSTSMVFANCAPNVLAAMLPQPARGAFERVYGEMPLSTSLFTAHFGINASPAKFGLHHYGIFRLPDWVRSLRDIGRSTRILADNPGGRMPVYGIANYGAIDSGLGDGGSTLVTVVGLDRMDNWSGLSPTDEKDRRARWLDAFQGALDRAYPGIGSAITERMLLTARSMHNFLNTPDGAVYGFAPLPPTRGIWAGIPRSPKTPIAGVYLASSFAGSGGYTGTMRSGAEAAWTAMQA